MRKKAIKVLRKGIRGVGDTIFDIRGFAHRDSCCGGRYFFLCGGHAWKAVISLGQRAVFIVGGLSGSQCAADYQRTGFWPIGMGLLAVYGGAAAFCFGLGDTAWEFSFTCGKGREGKAAFGTYSVGDMCGAAVVSIGAGCQACICGWG